MLIMEAITTKILSSTIQLNGGVVSNCSFILMFAVLHGVKSSPDAHQ